MSNDDHDHETPADRARREGRESGKRGGDWRDNPHTRGTREYFEFESGRREGGADDVGPSPGNPSWA